MTQGEALYKLQETDLQLLKNQKRLQEIAAQLADNEAVQAAQKDVDEATATLRPLKTTLHDLELQMQSAKTKQKNTEDRLYSGVVNNPRELQDMQAEIESLKSWQSELDNRILEAMVAVEDAQSELDDSQAHLDTVMKETESENADLLHERAQCHSRIERLQHEREQIIKQVTAANLQRYETMRPKKANRPISKLDGGANCSVCGVEQNAVYAKKLRQSEELLPCANCGRILVNVR